MLWVSIVFVFFFVISRAIFFCGVYRCIYSLFIILYCYKKKINEFVETSGRWRPKHMITPGHYCLLLVAYFLER